MRHRGSFVRLGAAGLVLLALSPWTAPVRAQPDMEPPISRDPGMEMEMPEDDLPELEPQERARPTARAARIEVGEAPVIDGDLSDVSWAKATVIDDIRQRQPDPGTRREREDRRSHHVRREQSLFLRLRV